LEIELRIAASETSIFTIRQQTFGGFGLFVRSLQEAVIRYGQNRGNADAGQHFGVRANASATTHVTRNGGGYGQATAYAVGGVGARKLIKTIGIRQAKGTGRRSSATPPKASAASSPAIVSPSP
jgi:hypothetical protein